MSKLHKILITVISVMLAVAAIFGVVTRNSYKSFNPDEAKLDLDQHSSFQCLKRFNDKNLSKQLEAFSSAFVVTVEKNEFCHRATKTTVKVDRVVKGDPKIANQRIAIFEPNHMIYEKNFNKTYGYFLLNNINNIMQPGKQYLVFADEIEYSEKFKEALEIPEYTVELSFSNIKRILNIPQDTPSGKVFEHKGVAELMDDSSWLYSFPLDDKVEPIKLRGNAKYGDIKSYDYFCYTEEEAKLLEDIRVKVLNEYL